AGSGVRADARARLPAITGRAARVLPPIRTFTVGPGIPPGQPTAGAGRLGRVADCHRRLGVSPTPEHAFAVVTSVPHKLFRPAALPARAGPRPRQPAPLPGPGRPPVSAMRRPR